MRIVFFFSFSVFPRKKCFLFKFHDMPKNKTHTSNIHQSLFTLSQFDRTCNDFWKPFRIIINNYFCIIQGRFLSLKASEYFFMQVLKESTILHFLMINSNRNYKAFNDPLLRKLPGRNCKGNEPYTSNDNYGWVF